MLCRTIARSVDAALHPTIRCAMNARRSDEAHERIENERERDEEDC